MTAISDKTAADSHQIIAELKRKLDERTSERDEALERQTATADILKVIASSRSDVQPVFEAIATSAKRLIGGFSTTVFSIVDDVQHLSALTPTSPAADAALKARFPAPLSAQPWAEQIRNGEIVNVADIETESAVPADLRDVWRMRGFRALLLVPLRRDRASIGMISLTRREPGTFAVHDVQLLQTFADQAVIAIQNARLFNETREALEQQKASADILAVISSSVADPQPVFDKILVSCKHLFGGDELDVLLVDEQGQLNIAAYIGDSHNVVAATFPASVERTPAGRAIRERRVMHWPDLLGGEDVPGVLRKMAKLIGYRSMVFAPMLWEGRGIGAIGVGRSTGPFKPKELAMIQTFADQAVIAIQNARLFNETREALERQTATADILKVIASSPSDVQPVFEAIAERSKRLVDALSTTVFRLEDGVMHLRAFTPTNPEADAMLKAMFPAPLSNFSWSAAIGNGEIYRVVDTELEIDGLRELARLRGFRSMLFVPLLRDRKPIGVIAVTRVESGPFVEHHVQLLQTFADQAVIAIENVRLFDEVQARTNDLSESLRQQTAVGDVLKTISRSTFDLQPVLDTLVQTAGQLCDTEMAFIMRREGDVYRAGAAVGYSQDYIEFLKNHPLEVDRGTITGRAVLERRTVQILDTATDPEYLLHESTSLAGQHTALCVPLLRENEPIGTIVLARQRVEAFTPKQIELVTTFADQAVIAIENVRLFEQVQARTRELSQSLDDLRTAQDRLVQTEKLASLGQLTAGIAHEIKNPLNFVNNFSALSAELVGEMNDVLAKTTLDARTRCGSRSDLASQRTCIPLFVDGSPVDRS
jgi:GAF domain-containing protein